MIAIPAGPAGSGVDAEVKRLQPAGQAGRQAEGLVLTVTTRIGTLTETPDAAAANCASACPAWA